MREICFQAVAQTELNQAAAWYEEKREQLGLEFLHEIDRCLHLAARDPQAFTLLEENIRFINTKRFPYRIYFRHEDKRVVVLAIFHHRRNPSVLLNALRS